jgi:threonine synthase
MYQLIDFLTKRKVTPKNFVFTGKTGPWELSMDFNIIKNQLNLDYFKTVPPRLAKYLPLLPVKSPHAFVSFKEEATPLMQSRVLSKQMKLDLWFKLEGKNPTGSFKDRGSAVEISAAKELGASAIIVASTGNMAASCACYAAIAKIPCFVLVPKDAPLAKLAQVIAFGGHIIKINGDYNDAAQLAKRMAVKMGFYLAGDYAFRLEGQKTAAFELVDQLCFQAPDLIVIPMGCGTNIAAYAKGFAEYRQLGLLKKIPRLIGVQAQGASAIVESFLHKKNTITPFKKATTLASSIAVANPVDGIKALDALYATRGSAIAVTDLEILDAQHKLSKEEGLFVESGSAATLAALMKIPKSKLVNKKIVCVLTGDGLKDPEVSLKLAATPPIIDPNEKAFMKLYNTRS